MKVYISGKMRGMTEEESRSKFKEAELHLKALGCEVVNPWDSEDDKKRQCKEWDDYILYDLQLLRKCDAIFMLDNWQDSNGAKCEHAFAAGRGMEIIYENQRFRSIPKPILDACCGGKMFYFDKHDKRVLFQDIRRISTKLCDGRPFEIEPDIIGDFTNMQFPDNSFRMVVFDPPHLLRNIGKSKFADIYGSLNPKAQPKGWQHTKYGALGQSDWKDYLRAGFAECFRVLQPNGFLIFKWNDTDIKVSKILELTPYKPIFGHISGKRANTHWICFMKDEKSEWKIKATNE